MLLLSALLLIAYAYDTFRRLRAVPSVRLSRNAMRLLYSAVFSLPFITIRAIYSVVYSFDTSPSVNPITGVFAVKLVLIFLVQLLATLCIVVGGVMTRNIRIENENVLSGPAYVRATSGEPRRSSPSQEYVMYEHNAMPEQHGKSRGPEFRC
jgi:hypothetical protein